MAFKKRCICLLFVCFVSGQSGITNVFDLLLNRNERNPEEKLTRDTRKFRSSYDFIVIGAGSAGSVITNRLTEISDWDVLLIEAGRDETFMTDIPLIQASLGVTQYNWGYKVERQSKACLRLKDGVCRWPTGKGVGGTTVINDLLYSRGNKYDYDQWRSLGNDGWAYEDVLPYFIKSERAKLKDIDTDYHGVNGYLNVENTPYRSKLVDAFLESSKVLNYSVTDINGKKSLGFSAAQSTLRSGRKCSASKAFLRPIRDRSNFHITKESFVTKILIDPKTKQAIGVEFKKNGKLYRIRARKEVILSAGTTNSAQLLMLSGIGPRKHLEDLNITVIQDLPVGYNLQDHTSFPGLVFLVNESITLTGPKILSISSMTDYITRGEGPYTLPGGSEAYAFINTKTNNITDENFADLELILAGTALNSDTLGIVRNLIGLSDGFYNTLYDGIKDKDGFALVPTLMKPYSRGRIMLRSANPYDSPLIYPNFFDDERDLKVMVEGAKMAVRLGESTPFSRFSSRLNPRPYPFCTQPFRSDAYWRCCIQSYTSTLFHYAGTCKMGPKDDATAVVDPQLRVHGVKGLRVVDASVMPVIPAAHTNAPTIMVGEKAGDLVKKEWGKLR